MFWWRIELLLSSPKGSHRSQSFLALSLFSHLLLSLGEWMANTNDWSLIFFLANYKRMSCIPLKEWPYVCVSQKRRGGGEWAPLFLLSLLALWSLRRTTSSLLSIPNAGLSLMLVMGVETGIFTFCSSFFTIGLLHSVGLSVLNLE